ncbi:MAG TPA: helix-turn-helix transcriptional regulator [Xanthobacteraceae bacterium]|nr:helix-turn-helix transcriptional regulator [Xanthobacteraceae bacterium]
MPRRTPAPPFDALSEAIKAARDPLATIRDAVDPPALRVMREQQERLRQLDAGGLLDQARKSNAHIADFMADRYRSPVRDALDVLGRRPGTAPANLPAPLPALEAPKSKDVRAASAADIGRAVRAARKAMGMTQQRFADLAGVGRRFLSELEGGKPTLEIDRVLAVCAAAGIDLVLRPR